MYGLYGRFADVDLAEKTVKDFVFPEDWARKYLGGKGLGARILVDELPENTDPLGPDNLLVFATGPFQGTGIAGGSRNVVMALSPVTGRVSGSYVGGFFPHELGQSGYDGLLIRGISKTPVYLLIQGGKVRILDASNLWGRDVLETVQTLQDLHPGVRVSCIGSGGERGVQYACILNDVNRAAGRPGFGSVMGSKKLKAIVVESAQRKPIYNERRLTRLRGEYARWLMEDPATQKRKQLGTAKCIIEENDLGLLPTKNFQEGVFQHADRISAEIMCETILERRDTCMGCPVSCKRVVQTSFRGEHVLGAYGGMEYETIAALGSLCLLDDLDAIALAGQKCNQFGIDTIATGVAIAAAMEATERGLLRGDGIAWGDGEAVVELVEKIGRLEGLGALLGQGMRALEKEWGSDFILHVKGQAVPMHDVRGKKGMGISFATSPRGATHMEGLDDELFIGATDPTPQLGVFGPVDWLSWDRKSKLCVIYEDLMSFTNSLVMCVFVSISKVVGTYYPYGKILDLLGAVTGMQFDEEEMLTIGHRNYALMRQLSSKATQTLDEKPLPKRFFEAIPSGRCSGERIDERKLQQAISEHEKLRGRSVDTTS